MRVLVTGASGFIGGHLLAALSSAGYDVVAASRSKVTNFKWKAAPDLNADSDWSDLLAGIDAVIHLAGRAHVTHENCDAQTESLYHMINVLGTQSLVQQARSQGVKRFIYLSSCHAVATESSERIDSSTQPAPTTAYGRSKLEAEATIRRELHESSCSWTILRPPLVYGPGNQANFQRLHRLVLSGIPLPLAGIKNKRSFLYIDNLTSLIVRLLHSSKARNRTFLASDGQDVSTPELITMLADASGAKCRLFHVSKSLLNAASILPGLALLKKLSASLYLDVGEVCRELDWKPGHSMLDGLRTLAKNCRQ